MPDPNEGAQQAGASAASTSNSAAPKTDDVVTMTKAEFEAFTKAQIEPWQKKHSDAEAALGQLKKLSKLPPEAFDAERNFASMKTIVTALGVPADEVKDAETVRELELLVRGYQRKAEAKPNEPEADTFARYQEWQKAQGKAPAARTAADVTLAPTRNGGGAPASKSIADLADGPWDAKAAAAELRRIGSR